MPDDERPRPEDDKEFKEWLKNRKPDPDSGDVPASVTFMEMMRQAAARSQPPTPAPQATGPLTPASPLASSTPPGTAASTPPLKPPVDPGAPEPTVKAATPDSAPSIGLAPESA